MLHDRQITISAAGSRKATHWPAQLLYWSEMVERLRVPVRGTETMAEYLALPKSKQDDLKDVGGFVAGDLIGDRRKAHSVGGRDVITLDLDNIPAGGTNDTLLRLEGLGCAYAVYSTRKHDESRPRLRVLIPCNKTATPDQYEPLARRIASIIGMELCDPTTFEASRLMYWPSCCANSQYIYQHGDKPFLDVDGLLGTYTDWRNVNEWPSVPGAQQAQVKRAAQQGNPTEKTGVVGAFCKTYDIHRAIDTFLPGEYVPCDDESGRYTFTGGSTVGGVVVYDNGNFSFSHHATDPAGGKLCNAFDLVRLHKFADKDDEAKPDTPNNKLPSYTAMCEYVIADTHVAAILNQERYERATQDFSNIPDDNVNWMQKLAVSPTTGQPAKTSKNVQIILNNDPLLKGRIKMNRFAKHIIGIGPLPWAGRDSDTSTFKLEDDDDSGLRDYLEATYGITSPPKIEDGLRLCAISNGFDPLVSYLTGVSWDNIPRLDTLYVDYLGAEDCLYTRTVTRKAFTAAVARAMTPGCKFDTMTVIGGRQGLGKSTLFAKMGLEWFSDSVGTFEGKDAAELLQGVWIVEIGEMEAYSKTDVKAVKHFLSKCDDQYRAAYARKTEKHLRRCVFFGTTNDHDYLKDTTGNRRFWPIDTEVQKPTKSVFNDLDKNEIDQIWAEAYMRWQLGEPLYLSAELEVEADKRRSIHMERDPLQGQIEGFLDKPVPGDWNSWDLERRRLFWGGGAKGTTLALEQRNRVCAIEIWYECLYERRTMTKSDSSRINAILESTPGWERAGVISFGPTYDKQRGFRRKVGGNILGNILKNNAQFGNILENGHSNNGNIIKQECC